jgi:hypothetical protein
MAVAAPTAKAGSITYTYQGNDFASFTTSPSPYTTSDAITGSFTIASALADNLTAGNITSNVSTFSFTDGAVNTLIPSNTGDQTFLFSTNSQGNITAWRIGLITNVAAPNNNAVFTCNGISGVNNCTNFPIDESYVHNGQSTGYNESDPGTWTSTLNGFQGGPGSMPVFLLSGPPVAEVTGTIGGLGSEDYYSFLWAGGAFSATASITGANTGASYLFSEGVAGTCSGGGTATLNGSDSFSSTIATANLAAGQYCIGIDANNSNDPAFALTFNTPVEGVATPEPSTVVLLSAGLGMIVLRLTKRSREDS